MTEQPFAHPSYEKPPIIEAVIELSFADKLDEAQLKRAADAVPAEYGLRKGMTGYGLKVTAAGPVSETIGKGWRLTDATAQKVVIIRDSLVAAARLPPYPGWDKFFGESWEVFARMRAKIGYRKLVKVGIRYVNRLDIPNENSGDFGDYLNCGLKPLPMLGISHPKAFLTQSDYFPEADVAQRIIVRSGTVEPAIIGHSSLLLDVDVHAEKDLPQSEVDLQKLMHKLRETKNRVFKACVTSKAEALFKAR